MRDFVFLRKIGVSRTSLYVKNASLGILHMYASNVGTYSRESNEVHSLASSNCNNLI